VLQQLDPEQHAIGWAYALHIKANKISLPAGEWDAMFAQQVKQLIIGGDAEQLRFARKQICDICRVFTEHCRA
jgi:hypothetical protein